MIYLYADIHITPNTEESADILSAMLGEIGFDTFESTDTGIKAYIQKDLFVESDLQAVLSDFYMPAVSFTYYIYEMENVDYNEEWEREHFDPVLEREFGIRLDPKMAFGSGSHETTHQLVSLLMEMDFTGQRVLDMGCGTGVLGIAMAKQGAEHVTAIDIDDMSVANTQLNFSLNFSDTDSLLTTVCGNASVIEAGSKYQTIVANIFKQVLIADLPTYADHLSEGGSLILSGFYSADTSDILSVATSLGLTLVDTRIDNDWVVLLLKK